MFGKLPGGEIWNSGFWLDRENIAESTPLAMNQLASDVATAMTKATAPIGLMLVTRNVLWGAGTTFDGVRTYFYDGGTTASTVGGFDLVAPVVGAGAIVQPDQVAMVLTLRTDLAGRRSRGRMYLPANKAAIDASGNVDLANIQLIVDAASTSFGLLKVAPSQQLVVVSRVGGTKTPVTSLSMDTRPDIQRRRANKQAIAGTGRHLLA